MNIEDFYHKHYQNAQLPITAYTQDGLSVNECTVTDYGLSHGASIATIRWHYNTVPEQSYSSSVDHLHLTREAAEAEMHREKCDELLNDAMENLDESLTPMVRTAFLKNSKEDVEKAIYEAFGIFSAHLASKLDLSLNFRNNYECGCGETWQLKSDSMHNDRCPECDTETVPFESVEC